MWADGNGGAKQYSHHSSSAPTRPHMLLARQPDHLSSAGRPANNLHIRPPASTYGHHLKSLPSPIHPLRMSMHLRRTASLVQHARISESINESINELIDESSNELSNESINGYMNESMNKLMNQ